MIRHNIFVVIVAFTIINLFIHQILISNYKTRGRDNKGTQKFNFNNNHNENNAVPCTTH